VCLTRMALQLKRGPGFSLHFGTIVSARPPDHPPPKATEHKPHVPTPLRAPEAVLPHICNAWPVHLGTSHRLRLSTTGSVEDVILILPWPSAWSSRCFEQDSDGSQQTGFGPQNGDLPSKMAQRIETVIRRPRG
jgi:hypothetical protein